MSLLHHDKPMTVEAFLAFTEAQPGDERWELIDGTPVMNPSPTRHHQKIVANLIYELEAISRSRSAWEVMPGLGVRLSQTSMPVPDVLIRPHTRIAGSFCDDMIVAFEVLSPSSRMRDLRWKRQAYADLPSLQHYIVIHQDEISVRCFDRADDWAERRLGLAETLNLGAVAVTLPIRTLYYDTGL